MLHAPSCARVGSPVSHEGPAIRKASVPSPAAAATTTESPAPVSPVPKRTPRDIHHVLATGQSNAIGTMAVPPLTFEQPYENLMFDTGLLKADNEAFRKLVPLVEGDLMPGRVYRVETMSSGF